MHVWFWPVFIGLEFLVWLQIPLARWDGYYTQGQRHCLRDVYTLTEHGGWWTDLLVISPAFAYVASQNSVRYLSGTSLFLAIASTIVWVVLCRFYAHQAIDAPEAHTHDGRTTPAGYVHAVYAIIATWFAGMFYFGGFETLPTGGQRWAMFGAVWTLVVIGGVKFSKRWRWSTTTTLQAIGVAVVLAVAEVYLAGLI